MNSKWCEEVSQHEPAVFWNCVVLKRISSSSTLHFWTSVVFRAVVTVRTSWIRRHHFATLCRYQRTSTTHFIKPIKPGIAPFFYELHLELHKSGVHTLKKLHAQVTQSWLSWTSSRRTVYHGVSRGNLAHVSSLQGAGIDQSINEWIDGIWWNDQPINEKHDETCSVMNVQSAEQRQERHSFDPSGPLTDQDGEHPPRFPQLLAAAFLRSCQHEFFFTRHALWCHNFSEQCVRYGGLTCYNKALPQTFDIIFAHTFLNRSHSTSGIIGSRILVIHSVTMSRAKPNFLRRRTDGDLPATFYLQGLSPGLSPEGAGSRLGGPIASRQKVKRASSNLSRLRPMPLLPYQRGPESPVLSVPPSNSIKVDSVDVEVPESCLPNLKALKRRSTLPSLDLRSEALMLSRQLHLDFHEVKFVLQELRSESTLPTGGLDYTTFGQCLQRICGVELEDEWIGTAYKECHGEGHINSEQLLIWYRDHIFDLEACKRKRRFANGTVPQVTLDLAKRFHCSCLDLDKVKVKFDDFDLDKSGYIDHYDFEKMLYQLLNCSSQSDFPKARLQRFWNEADKNGDGQIDFEEFLEWYMKYFGTTYENGPMDAFYASFMPVLHRSDSFGELKSHECCLQPIHVRWVEPRLW